MSTEVAAAPVSPAPNVESTEASLPDLPSASETSSAPVDEIQAAIDAVNEAQSKDTNGPEDSGRDEPSDGGTANVKQEPKEENKDSKPEPQGPKSSAWASLHKQKLELQQQRDAFAKDRAETARIKALIDNAKQDRLSALEALGYTDVKSFIQGLVEDGGRMTPERAKVLELEKKIADRERQEQEQREAYQKEQQTAQQRAQLDSLHNQVLQQIKQSHNESLVSIDGSSQMVMQEMDRLAGETGVMPDISQAIENVAQSHEKHLKQILENPRAQAIARELLASHKTAPNAPRQKASIKTIGDTVASGTAPPKPKGEYDPSDELEQMVAWLNKK